MGFLLEVNFFLALFIDSAKRLFSLRIWLVLLAYFCFHWLILYSHYKFYSPVFYGIIEPWIRLVDPQNAVGFIHYPGHYLTLPYFFSWAKFLLSIPFEGAVLGSVAILFYRTYVRDQEIWPQSRSQWLYVWGQVILGWLVINGLILLINTYLPSLLGPMLHQSPRREFVFRYMFIPGLYTFMLALFYFTIPYAAIRQVSVFRALGWSVQNLWRNPVTCFVLAAVILSVPVLISVIIGNSPTLVAKFKPELVYWLLLTGLVADMLVNFFWMGTAIRFILDRG